MWREIWRQIILLTLQWTVQRSIIPPCSLCHRSKLRFSRSRQHASSASAFTASAPFPSLIGSFVLGISLFAATFLADSFTSKVVLKGDPIFSMRRTLVVSVVGWGLWLLFLVLGVGLGLAFGWMLWVKFSLLGFAVVVTLRFLVFNSVSSVAAWRRHCLSILLQPALSIAAFLIFWVSYPTVVTVSLAGLPLRGRSANSRFHRSHPLAFLD